MRTSTRYGGGGMVAVKIMMVMVSMLVQRTWPPCLHGGTSEESRCGSGDSGITKKNAGS
jgi:hypothetical protein